MHIANTGLTPFPVAELYNIDFAQVDACAKAVAENADMAIGVKVRMSENVIAKHGTEPLKRAIMACEKAGTGARIMCHIGGVETRELMSQILDLLRPGDVLTHAYSGAPNIAGQFTNIVQDGRLLPAALAAKQRGVVFDVGHGGGSFDYTVCEAAMQQGCPPDTISSDIHVFSGNSPGMPYLTWVMSKFMGLGFTLEQVVAMATSAPAKVIDRQPKLGTLQVGAPADVSIMELVQGPVSFVDTRNNTRTGQAHLQAGADGDRRRAVRAALQFALRRALTSAALARGRGTPNPPGVPGRRSSRCQRAGGAGRQGPALNFYRMPVAWRPARRFLTKVLRDLSAVGSPHRTLALPEVSAQARSDASGHLPIRFQPSRAAPP